MIKRLTIEDCIKAAEQLGGECLEFEYKNNTTKMKWRCKEKHIFSTIFKTVRKGHWCPECAGVKKLTHNFVEKHISSKGGTLLSPYISSGEKLKIQCNKDSHIWYPTWDSIKQDHWCPRCNKVLTVGIDEIERDINNKNGILIDGSAYIDARSILVVQCNKDKHIWETTRDYLKQGNWCPMCAGKFLLSRDEIVEFAKNKDAKVLDCPEDIKVLTKIKLKCLKDEHIWSPSYFSMIYNGSWCPKCVGKVLKTFDEVRLFVESKDGLLLADEDDLIRNTSKLKVQCKDGHIWNISYGNLMNTDKWCPKCKFNRTQLLLYDILCELYGKDCEFNYRGFEWLKSKKKLEIDIWVPSIKLGIEYDGIHHFKAINYYSDINMAEQKLKDRKAMDLLKDNLIRQHPDEVKHFLRIPYTQKINKENILGLLKYSGIPI